MEKQIEVNETNLKVLQKWCTPFKTYEKWTEYEELRYIKGFGEPYMYLPEEIADENEEE